MSILLYVSLGSMPVKRGYLMTHQLEDFAQKDGQGSERPKPGLRHPLTLDVRDGVEPPRAWLALALLCAAQFMVVLDFSIVNVALPSMQKSLGFSPTTLQWVVSAYSLLFGGFLLLGGRAADLFGRRRVFLLGLVLFTLASLGGGFAQSPLELIVARASQGLAASIVAPSVLSLITTTFPQGCIASPKIFPGGLLNWRSETPGGIRC